MSIFTCPVCAEKLGISGNSYICPNNHSFDRAKSGYINLLLSKHVGKTVHGDNKLMVNARRDFLEKGYYAPLKDALCDKVNKHFSGRVLLDAGCGEGYYTSAISDSLENSETATEIYGIDISKIAVESASKRKKNIAFAVASVFHIPVESGACDMLVTMFAPYCAEEYQRVLRENGIMVMAIPSAEHLWELKKAVYDTPYANEVKPYELDGFEFIDSQRITYDMNIDNNEDIMSLFSMTPYYYRTGRTQQERLEKLDHIITKADFEILVYRKK